MVGVAVAPLPVLLVVLLAVGVEVLALVLLAVGVDVLALVLPVQPDKATTMTTTRTAAWKTEALIIFIFGLPLSFAIHPPRGENCVQCRKG